MTTNSLISIGNSDDSLTQSRWSEFISTVRGIITRESHVGNLRIHGEWFSKPDSPWQNANWCVEFTNLAAKEPLANELVTVREKFNQDSIAWTEGEVTFI